jgi:hypothetical protein
MAEVDLGRLMWREDGSFVALRTEDESFVPPEKGE